MGAALGEGILSSTEAVSDFLTDRLGELAEEAAEEVTRTLANAGAVFLAILAALWSSRLTPGDNAAAVVAVPAAAAQ